MGMSQAELANRIGKTKKTVNEIIKGKGPKYSRHRFATGARDLIPAQLWASLEAYYRDFLVRQQEELRLKQQVD